MSDNSEGFVEFDLTQALTQDGAPSDPGPDPLLSLPVPADLVAMGTRQFLDLLRVGLAETGRRGAESTKIFQRFLLTDALEAILRLGESEAHEGELGEELLLNYLVLALSCPMANTRRGFARDSHQELVSWSPFYARLFLGGLATSAHSVPAWVPDRAKAIAARLGGAWLAIASLEDVQKLAETRPLWVIESLFHIPVVAKSIGFGSTQGALAAREVAKKFIDV